MEYHEIRERLQKLSRTQAKVLYWKCRGLTYDQMVSDQYRDQLRLYYGVDMIQYIMSQVYVMLGFDITLHHTKRKRILQDEVCPVLTELVPYPAALDDPRSPWPVDPPEMTQPNDYFKNALMVVIQDEEEEQREQNGFESPPPIIHINPPKPPVPVKKNSCMKSGLIFIAALVALVMCAGGVYVAYLIGRGGIIIPGLPLIMTATEVVEEVPAATMVAPTDAPVATQTPEPAATNTLEAVATAVPTNTPEPTATPYYTPTQKAFYEENEGFYLDDGVYVYIEDRFAIPGGTCEKPDNGFGVFLIVESTDNEQFLIRFDANTFSARDDLGNEYKFLATGIQWCMTEFGLIEQSIGIGNDRVVIPVTFKGVIPLEANYIFLTAKTISGKGPLVFRKSIY